MTTSPDKPARTAILIKLLAMTTSPNDGEALVAIRKANQIAHDANLDLVAALTTTTTTSLDKLRILQLEKAAYDRGYEAGLKAEKQSNMPPWQDAREILINDYPLSMSPKDYKFVEGLSKYPYLSEKQRLWLNDIWRRVNPSMSSLPGHGGD